MWRLVAERRWDRIALLRSQANRDLVGLIVSEIGFRLDAAPMDAARMAPRMGRRTLAMGIRPA